MRSEQDIRQLKEELDKLTSFINDGGIDNALDGADILFAYNVAAALGWVLEDIRTENFRSDLYLNLEHLEHIAKAKQTRTGEKFTGYE